MKYFWNKTNHRAGGLTGIGLDVKKRLQAPRGWVAPRFLDLRGYCLPKSDQGATSQCAAYAMAGLLEARNWRIYHTPIQIDPAPIYARAKMLDGDTGEGTTLMSVFEAAKGLGLLPKMATAVPFRTLEDYAFALHKYGPVLLGMQITKGWSYVPKTGWIPEDVNTVGGHATLGCFCDLERGPGGQNSWGEWGADGFYRMTPKQYDDQIMGGLAVEVPGEF